MRFHRAFLAPIALLAATQPPPETTLELRKDDQLGGFVRITQATRIVGEEYKHDATSMTRAMYFVKEGNKNPDNNNVPTQSVTYCTPCEAARIQTCRVAARANQRAVRPVDLAACSELPSDIEHSI